MNCHDSFKPMVELWNTIVVDGATNLEKKDELYWENNLIEFVNRVYSVLYAEKFKYDELDPAKMALGDPILMNDRLTLINSCIQIDKGKKTSK